MTLTLFVFKCLEIIMLCCRTNFRLVQIITEYLIISCFTLSRLNTMAAFPPSLHEKIINKNNLQSVCSWIRVSVGSLLVDFVIWVSQPATLRRTVWHKLPLRFYDVETHSNPVWFWRLHDVFVLLTMLFFPPVKQVYWRVSCCCVR